tara:strand:+ start:1160 stop:1924 length:765 start_codon:yes stop_codon:yes gene_type:complete
MTAKQQQLALIQKTIEAAEKLGNKRDAYTLNSFLRHRQKRKLTYRQEDFLKKLIERNDEAALKALADKNAEWEREWRTNDELRAKAEVIANYYLTTAYYNSPARRVIQWRKIESFTAHSEEEKNELYATCLPPERQLMSMVNNKYANKVWQSHIAEPKWKVGDMVAIRKTYKGTLGFGDNIATRHYVARVRGVPMYDELSYMVIAVDSKPIDEALKYNEKTGGCRYYKLLPIGHPTPVDVMECNLKKLLKKQVS